MAEVEPVLEVVGLSKEFAVRRDARMKERLVTHGPDSSDVGGATRR